MVLDMQMVVDGWTQSVGVPLHPPHIPQHGLRTQVTFLWARAGLEMPGREAVPQILVFFADPKDK